MGQEVLMGEKYYQCEQITHTLTFIRSVFQKANAFSFVTLITLSCILLMPGLHLVSYFRSLKQMWDTVCHGSCFRTLNQTWDTRCLKHKEPSHDFNGKNTTMGPPSHPAVLNACICNEAWIQGCCISFVSLSSTERESNPMCWADDQSQLKVPGEPQNCTRLFKPRRG